MTITGEINSSDSYVNKINDFSSMDVKNCCN